MEWRLYLEYGLHFLLMREDIPLPSANWMESGWGMSGILSNFVRECKMYM